MFGPVLLVIYEIVLLVVFQVNKTVPRVRLADVCL